MELRHVLLTFPDRVIVLASTTLTPGRSTESSSSFDQVQGIKRVNSAFYNIYLTAQLYSDSSKRSNASDADGRSSGSSAPMSRSMETIFEIPFR